jgi:hypothetical protein
MADRNPQPELSASDSGHDEDQHFCFNGLPTELKLKILEELLRPELPASTEFRLDPTGTWPLRSPNRLNLETAVLPTDKKISILASTTLHTSNKCIVFDVGCSHLLLQCVYLTVPCFLIDPEDTVHLPLGVIRVKVRFSKALQHGLFDVRRHWPKSTLLR